MNKKIISLISAAALSITAFSGLVFAEDNTVDKIEIDFNDSSKTFQNYGIGKSYPSEDLASPYISDGALVFPTEAKTAAWAPSVTLPVVNFKLSQNDNYEVDFRIKSDDYSAYNGIAKMHIFKSDGSIVNDALNVYVNNGTLGIDARKKDAQAGTNDYTNDYEYHKIAKFEETNDADGWTKIKMVIDRDGNGEKTAGVSFYVNDSDTPVVENVRPWGADDIASIRNIIFASKNNAIASKLYIDYINVYSYADNTPQPTATAEPTATPTAEPQAEDVAYKLDFTGGETVHYDAADANQVTPEIKDGMYVFTRDTNAAGRFPSATVRLYQEPYTLPQNAQNYLVEYNVKCDEYNTFSDFGEIFARDLNGNQINNSVLKSYVENGTLYTNYGSWQRIALGKITDFEDENGWIKIKYVVDLNENTNKATFNIYINDDTKDEWKNLSVNCDPEMSGLNHIAFNAAKAPSSQGHLYLKDMTFMAVCDGNLPPEIVKTTVKSISPSDEASNVSIDSDVVISFTQAINPNTIDGNIDVLSEEFTSSLSADNKTVTLSFKNKLQKSTQYTVVIKNGLKDTNGYSISGKKSFTFTTSSKNSEDIYFEDFEGYTISDGAEHANLKNGDFLWNAPTVADFNVKAADGNKYLSLVKAKNTLNYNPRLSVPVKEPVISYSFRMKIDSCSGDTQHLGTVNGTFIKDGKEETGEIIKISVDANGRLWFSDATEAYQQLSVLSNAADKQWHTYNIVMNTVDDTYSVFLDGKLVKENAQFYSTAKNAKVNVTGMTGYSFYCGNSTEYQAAMDDLKISRPECLKVSEVMPEDTSAMPLDAEVKFVFNKPIKADNIENAVKVNGGKTERTISLDESKKILTVSMSGLEYKTDYKIEISGINSDETISVPMAQAYEYTITTKPRNFDIVSYTVKDSQGNTVTDLSTVKGQTVTVCAELKNYELNENKNYEFIAALKSKDSKLTDCDSFKGALGLGESETASVQLNVPSEGDYTLEIFVWSSLESGVPILDKIVF